MTTLREAAQQALEALELPCSRWNGTQSKIVNDAITALRAALAEPVLNPAPGYCKHCKQYTIEEPLPAEPVQEPVAWMYEDTLPKEYPYDAMWPHSAVRDGVRMFPVFAPPQRKPLTDEEIDAVVYECSATPMGHEWELKLARAIERAHGIGEKE